MTGPEGLARRFVAVDHPSWTQAHASSVLDVDGDLLAAWFAGTREGAADTRIWCARRAAGSSAWSAPVVLASGDEAHWNPVLAHGPDSAVWLFYKRGHLISRWTTWVRRSLDGGHTWSEPCKLVPGDVGGRGPVKNPPILLPDGSWLAPGSRESWNPEVRWDAFVDISTDQGRTWRAVPIPLDRRSLAGAGVIQPALWRSGDTVVALMRSTEGRAFRTASRDGGITWSVAEPVELPNNNSALTVVPLHGGAVACVHNPVAGNWAARCPLVVSASGDEGLTWRRVVTVEDGRTPADADPSRRPSPPPSGSGGFAATDGGVATTGTGEYSYPSAIVNGRAVTITYTWQRRGIVEASVPVDSIAPEEP